MREVGDGSNVEPESKEQEVDMSNAELIDSNLSFSKGECNSNQE